MTLTIIPLFSKMGVNSSPSDVSKKEKNAKDEKYRSDKLPMVKVLESF